jgi:hypothetical protein
LPDAVFAQLLEKAIRNQEKIATPYFYSNGDCQGYTNPKQVTIPKEAKP